MKEKITVIVPIFNVEPYLFKCIDSIIKQTYDNLQIILINDGSIDNSGKICEEFLKKDKRIEVYHTENRGLVSARKLGLKMAKGKYISFVDADDYIEPNMISELLFEIKKYHVDFVHFGYIEENKGNQKNICNFEEGIFELNNIEDRMKFLSNFILNQCLITPSIWSKLFKIDFIKKCYQYVPDTQQYGEDIICLYRCVFECQRIFLKRKALYHYTIRENSLSHLKIDEYVMNEINLWHYIVSILNEYKCLVNMKKNMHDFFKEHLLYLVELLSDRKVHISRYFFKNIEQLFGKRLIIFGAGNVGQDYYNQICKYSNCNIVAWVDTYWYKYNFEYASVFNMKDIVNFKYDIIVIAVSNNDTVKDIKKLLVQIGVSIDKILWQKPGEYF